MRGWRSAGSLPQPAGGRSVSLRPAISLRYRPARLLNSQAWNKDVGWMVNLTWFSWIKNVLSAGEVPRLSAMIEPRFGCPSALARV